MVAETEKMGKMGKWATVAIGGTNLRRRHHLYTPSIPRWTSADPSQLAFQMVPAIPLLFVVLVLPESPRWLMIRGREEEALQVLAQLHARGDVDDPLVQGEFHEMKMTVAKDAAEATSWKELVQPQNFRKM